MAILEGNISSNSMSLNGDVVNKATEWGLISGDIDNQTDLQEALEAKQDEITSTNKLPANLVSGLATVATSGSYNDLSNKPTISDASINIKKNGALVQSFSLNQDNDQDVNISVPTKTSDLTKDDVYTKTEDNTLLAGKVDKVAGKGLSTNDYDNTEKGLVASAIQPNDNVSELTNDVGYINKNVNDLTNYSTTTQMNTAISAHHDSTKVDKVSGKGLSENDFTTTLKNKLDGIAEGAEVNVQSDWAENDSTKDSFIKNKPSIPTLDNYYTKPQTDTLLNAKVDTTTLANYSTTSQMNTAIEGHHDTSKQDVISDLATIRQGASLGATALQSVPNTYRTSADQDVIDNTKVDKITGKGLSENDFTTTLKTKLDGISANAKNVSVSATGTSTDEVQYITIDGVEKKLAGGGGSVSGAVRYDIAQSLTDSQKAQAKDNIGETQDVNALAKHTQDVYDDKFNQQIINGNFVNTNNWQKDTSKVNFSALNNIAKIEIITPSLDAGQYAIAQSKNSSIVGHKYLVSLQAYLSSNGKVGIFGYGGSGLYDDNVQGQSWNTFAKIFECGGVSNDINIYAVTSNTSIGDYAQLKNVMFIDLTQIYGAGNEPTTIAQFKASYPLDYYPYSLGNTNYVEFSKAQSLTDAQKQQARSNIGASKDEGNYELIENITLTQDISNIVRTQTPQGVPYNFSKIYVSIVGTRNYVESGGIFMFMNNDYDLLLSCYSLPTTSEYYPLSDLFTWVENNKFKCKARVCPTQYRSNYTNPLETYYDEVSNCTNFTSLNLNCYGSFKTGTTITIYGVWK